MYTVFVLFSILAVFYLFVNYYKKQQRYLLSKKLSSIYDAMEMNFIINSKNLTNDEIKFIKTYKSISTNPDLLDIHLLLISKLRMNKQKLSVNKSLFDLTLSQQDQAFKDLVGNFDEVAGKLIKLSIYNKAFILFVLKAFIKYLAVKGQYNIVTTYGKFVKEINFATKNEGVLIQHQVAI